MILRTTNRYPKETEWYTQPPALKDLVWYSEIATSFKQLMCYRGFPHDVLLRVWRIFWIHKGLTGWLAKFSFEFLNMSPLLRKKNPWHWALYPSALCSVCQAKEAHSTLLPNYCVWLSDLNSECRRASGSYLKKRERAQNIVLRV